MTGLPSTVQGWVMAIAIVLVVLFVVSRIPAVRSKVGLSTPQ